LPNSPNFPKCTKLANLPLREYQYSSYSPNSVCASTYFCHTCQTGLAWVTTSTQYLLFGKNCRHFGKNLSASCHCLFNTQN
jgi:hypothetical protein